MGPAWGETADERPRAVPPLRPRPGLLESPPLAPAPPRKHRGVSEGCPWNAPQGPRERKRSVSCWSQAWWGLGSFPKTPTCPLARLRAADPPRERGPSRASCGLRARWAGWGRARSKKSRGQTGLSLEGVHLPWAQGRGRTRLCPLSPCAKWKHLLRNSAQLPAPHPRGPSAAGPRQAAQPPSALSLPRGSARSVRPSPAISRGWCARRRPPCPGCLIIRTRVRRADAAPARVGRAAGRRRGRGPGCSGGSRSRRLGARSPGRPGGAAAGSTAPLVSWGSQVPPVEAKKWNTGSQAPGLRGASVIARGGAWRPLSLRYCLMEAAVGARGSPSPPRGPGPRPLCAAGSSGSASGRVGARCGREAVTPALARPCVPGWLALGRSPLGEGARGAQVGPLPGAPGPRSAGGLPRRSRQGCGGRAARAQGAAPAAAKAGGQF